MHMRGPRHPQAAPHFHAGLRAESTDTPPMHLFWLLLIFVAALGACVGSFLNVVAYRLPEGKSLVSPPSACPKCGHRLAWFDNVPVLGWLWLRGKCRYCGAPISVQYPIIEAITALLFAGLYLAYFATDLRWAFGAVPATLFGGDLPVGTWPVFAVHLFLLGSLVAATLIDAKLYIIPPSIPWLATAAALLVLPAATALGWLPHGPQPVAAPGGAADVLVPYTNGLALVAAGGAILGLMLGVVLLRLGVLPLSFADEADYLGDDPDPTAQQIVAAYPHPRREMCKELLFVGFPLLGLLAGFHLGYRLDTAAALGDWPDWVFVLGGCVLGYFTGAGLVWLTRILGTLAFGKEAMGLGDVHLMAAIGAVLGPIDATLAFFLAPFAGLLAYAVMLLLGSRNKDEPVRMIPYGPFLAGGAVLVMVVRNQVLVVLGL